MLANCAKCFPSFNEDNDKFDTQLTAFCNSFKQILEFETKIVLNHQLLHSLIFSILLYTHQSWHIVGLECPVAETGHSNRCDVVSSIENFLVIEEIKYNESISVAMKQITDRSYADIIKNEEIVENSKDITYIVHFGIAV